jgi:mannose-1-phosphate guanylyltransferase
MTAVILVGGPGTRLQPLTDDRPKSLVPVLNRPMMAHMIDYLKRFGIEDIVLTLSYLPDAIKQVFGDGQSYGVRIVYCVEKEPLGTAGAVKNTEEFLDGTFVVLNGDIFTDLDLADLIASHREKRAAATISLTWVEDPSAFGVVETDDSRRVRRFIEKPPRAEATSHWINAGIYILEPEVLGHIPAGQHYMFEKGLFPGILERGLPVYGYPYRGYWLDMGTPEKYFEVNMDLLGTDGTRYDPKAIIDPGAAVTAPALIDSGCRIGRGARISGPVIMGRDCRVEAGASIENTILWDGVKIGAGVRLSHCILASGTTVPAASELNDMIITANRTVPFRGGHQAKSDFDTRSDYGRTSQ